MKKLTAFICAAAMTLGMATTAVAAPSISTLIAEAPVVLSDNIPAGSTLTVQNVDTTKYTNTEVASVVEKFNDEAVTVSVADVLTELKVDTTQEIKTVGGAVVVKPEEYESVTPFADLVISDGTDVVYTVEGKVKVSIKVETIKDLTITAEDVKSGSLIIMQIDPETGEVYFIEIEDYDPETGEITAEFPCLGPFTILEKTDVEGQTEAAEAVTEAATEAVTE